MAKTTKKVIQSSNLTARFLEQAVENSIAQQKFEGLNPSDEIRQDLRNRASGKLTSKQVISNIMGRIQK